MLLFSLTQKIDSLLKRHPVKTLFAYSLFGEFLVLLFLFLAFLWTAETLLPGFISLRINLTWYLILLLLLTSLFLVFGKFQNIKPIQSKRFIKSLFSMIGLWSLLIIGVSLYHFSLWSILLILGCVMLISFLSWKHFFRD